MAQKKLLFIGSDGLPTEHTAASDDITFATITASGGPVMSSTGIDMNNKAISEALSLAFNDPTQDGIIQTAGELYADNIMGKDRTNAMASTSAIQFGVITDVVGEVDSLILPKLAGAPTAVPTGGEGSFLYDSSNDKLWIYTTAGWDDLSTVASAGQVLNSYVAAGALLARDAVYISAADAVTKAKADAVSTSRAIGFAVAAAADTDPVSVISEGVLSGFTGLTAGAPQYLSEATAGLITETLPVGTGNVIVVMGYAKSTTAVHVKVQRLGVRV